MSKFKTGDKVRGSYPFNGKEGTVCYVSMDVVTVAFSDVARLDFWAKDLALICQEDDSPQPQQNKPKEDSMRYAVISKNLAVSTNPQIQSSHPTEAEAKLAAEQLVAGWRASLQAKTYFTVAIVDMQTGKLVGSVTDAPPPVNWNQE